MADMKSIKFPGSDTVYTPVDQVARDEAAKKLNSDQLTTAINEALAQAKESGDFNGDPGKTAYQYAQDGGYTGTEEEFAAKLAAEIPEVTWNNLPGKPVVVEGTPDTLTWDGNTEGLVSNSTGDFVKISDATPSYADLSGGLTLTAPGVEPQVVSFADLGIGVMYDDGFSILIIHEAAVGVDIDGMIFPETGFYVAADVWGGKENISLTIPGYTGFGEEKIAPDHLYQPDWNQNDASAADFIKNRPFGDVLTEIMPETEVVAEYADGIYAIAIDPTLFAGTESELVVTFDGVEYNCTADIMFGVVGFGNMALVDPELTDTGEPFMIVPTEGVCAVADANPHTLRIRGNEPVKIPNKYIESCRVFYAKATGDVYMYKDAYCTEKLTVYDFMDYLKNPPIMVSIGTAEVGYPVAVASPVYAAMPDGFGVVLTTSSIGNKGELYTAEYVPETTSE